MGEVGDRDGFRKMIVLRNGTPVLIRMARADDRQRLVSAFEGLDRQTIYTRYFAFRKTLSEAELERLEAPDLDRYILLVATLGSGGDETIIAGASCVASDTSGAGGTAELAFTVEEDYQRQGLASQLLATITDLARSRGISRCEADVLADNRAMLSVFQRSGLPMTTSRTGGVVHLVLDLAA